jgi:hypothetical protein
MYIILMFIPLFLLAGTFLGFSQNSAAFQNNSVQIRELYQQIQQVFGVMRQRTD